MAVNAFLKFLDPEIRGGSTDVDHAGEIQILSWSHSFAQPSKDAGAKDADQAQHGDFTFSKYLDSATDDLLHHCWSAAPIGRAALACYRSDGDGAATLYLSIEMENVLVTNVSIGGGTGDLPTENISLAYDRITYAYTSDKDDRTSQAVTHDLRNRIVR